MSVRGKNSILIILILLTSGCVLLLTIKQMCTWSLINQNFGGNFLLTWNNFLWSLRSENIFETHILCLWSRKMFVLATSGKIRAYKQNLQHALITITFDQTLRGGKEWWIERWFEIDITWMKWMQNLGSICCKRSAILWKTSQAENTWVMTLQKNASTQARLDFYSLQPLRILPCVTL